MELRQLSYFTTIVNEGHISQAAKNNRRSATR